jgi:DNA polymerase
MHELFWDIESRSAASLRMQGAWRYASDRTTDALCLCFAVDDGDVDVWLPGQPVPAPFLEAARDPHEWRTITHNAEFERAVLEHVLVSKHGFAAIPIEVQHCSMALALANGYPAELDLLAQALGLEYQKDREGVRLVRLMSRPRKPRKGEDKNVLHWVFDEEKLQRLIAYCQQDVRTARAVWRHPKLRTLSKSERRVQILDSVINRRGVRGDRPLATAARDMALQERARLNAAMAELTAGTIKSVDQIERIRTLVNCHGHDLRSLGKRSVAAVLAAEPDNPVRQLLELRRDGARASTRKYERILACMSDNDDRMRGTMRFFGSATGRWSGRGPQLQNLKKNESGIPLIAIEAVRSGDRERLRTYGNPLTVLGDIARAVICAGPGNVLMAADFSAIESRILAWLAGEQWKLQLYADYDATSDKAREPYRVLAARMLHKADAATITPEERQKGKAGELACGFGGSVGAWRRIAPEDKRSDAEVLTDIRAWRAAHPKTTAFWHALARAIRIAIGTGQPFSAGKIVAEFSDGNLTLTLPSGRTITYPEVRPVPSNFEGAPPDVLFKDNARGKWTDYRGWFGTFAENVVQGTARDLLAAAIERFETRGIPIVLHVHDEVVAEVPVGSITEAEFLAILLEPPAWAAGLPLAGTVWSGSHYFEPPEESAAPPINPIEDAVDEIIRTEEVNPEIDDAPEDAAELAKADDEEFIADLADTVAPLSDLVSVPLTNDNKTTCPFHEGDDTPSLQFYADHFHCSGCGEHGDRLDWLMRGEEMTREEAIATIKHWDGPVQRPIENQADKLARALALWEEAMPIAGTLAERYLCEARKIELAALPADLNQALRFHPRCPFGPGARHPCLLALMRNPTTDAPTGIQRIGLTSAAKKIDRRMLGRSGTVKLWPAGAQLVLGEGIETVLAAATRISYRGAPLQPAWSAVSSGLLETFPVLPGVERLIIVVDHDFAGKAAAASCAERWSRAGRSVVRLTPKRAGADFNDLVMPERVS